MKKFLTFSVLFICMCCGPLTLAAHGDESHDSFLYIFVASVAASFLWAAICSIISCYFEETRLERTALWLQILSIAIHPVAWGLLFVGVLRPDDQSIGPLAIPCVVAFGYVVVVIRKLRSILAALVGNVLAFSADFGVFMGMMLGISEW